MKVMFISDIHGISSNLHVIDNFKFEKLVVLGDIFGSSEEENQKVLDFIQKYNNVLYIKGNCDNEGYLKRKNIPFVKEYLMLTLDGVDVYCTHGDKYNYYDFSLFDTDGVIIYGHEHYPYIKTELDNVYICVGSISRPRKESMPSLCFYENNVFTLYDINMQVIDSIVV